MTSLPPNKHGAYDCPACGEANRWPEVRFCAHDHPPGSPALDATTGASVPAPHLHRTCGRCKREDVIPTVTEKENR